MIIDFHKNIDKTNVTFIIKLIISLLRCFVLAEATSERDSLKKSVALYVSVYECSIPGCQGHKKGWQHKTVKLKTHTCV